MRREIGCYSRFHVVCIHTFFVVVVVVVYGLVFEVCRTTQVRPYDSESWTIGTPSNTSSSNSVIVFLSLRCRASLCCCLKRRAEQCLFIEKGVQSIVFKGLFGSLASGVVVSGPPSCREKQSIQGQRLSKLHFSACPLPARMCSIVAFIFLDSSSVRVRV